MSDTQTASQPEVLFDPYNPDRNIVRLCASLTINGVQCKQAALRGQNYCVAHIDRQPRAFENPATSSFPCSKTTPPSSSPVPRLRMLSPMSA